MKREKICGIYRITSPSGKIYIGQSVDCTKRERYYAVQDCSCQTKVYHSIKKYGWGTNKFEIIHRCTEEELNNLEAHYINFYNTFNSENGMNLRGGGGKSGSLSEETKTKIGDGNRGKIRSVETRKKISEHNKRLGKIPPSRSGVAWSAEDRLRISLTNKGRTIKRKPINDSVDWELSPELKRKLKASCKRYYANKNK